MLPLLVMLFWIPLTAVAKGPQLPEKETLIRNLVHTYGSQLPDSTRRLLAKQEFRYYPDALILNIHTRETGDRYARFHKTESIREARAFLEQERKTISAAAAPWKVEPEIVVALWYVESDLGRNQGRYPLLDVLLTLTCLDDSAVVDWNLRRGLKEAENEREKRRIRDKVVRRSQKKAAWARRELLQLLKLYPLRTIGELRSSYAGALGICQFLPSSLAAYGADGDGDGQIDLRHLPDAAASTARYLRENGRGENLDEKQRRRVIWRYNHSQPYVDAVYHLYYELSHGRKTKNGN